MKLLSRSEEIVLLAVWGLQGQAYGITIRQQIARITGNTWSIGAVYAPLHRLEKKEYVETHRSEPSAVRGGRSKVFYRLTPQGKQALRQVKHAHDALWDGIPALGFE